jgi:quinol monooxygenase YgiN
VKLIIESVCIAVRPAKREELRRALAAWKGPTGVEPGCTNCHILQETNGSDVFFYGAYWKSEDDLLRHLRSDHYKRLLVLMDLGDKPPLIEFHKVTESAGLELIERARTDRHPARTSIVLRDLFAGNGGNCSLKSR